MGTEDAAATRFVDLLSAQTGSLFESIVHEVDFESKRPDVAAFVKEHFGISKISREENDRLTKAYLDEKDNRRKNDLLFGRALADFLAARSEFYWATRNHSGKDVPVMAFGPYADRFAGYMDNTDIFRHMKDAMDL